MRIGASQRDLVTSNKEGRGPSEQARSLHASGRVRPLVSLLLSKDSVPSLFSVVSPHASLR